MIGETAIRPPLCEKLFPDDRPSGFKRAECTFFPYFFLENVVHSSQ